MNELDFTKISKAKRELSSLDAYLFDNPSNSFREYLLEAHIVRFRHLNELTIKFSHPVTVISGTNRVGKTSLLLTIACSFERFLKFDSTKPTTELRPHNWSDVIYLTANERRHENYVYRLKWRVGPSEKNGEGKRIANSGAWTGLAKRSKDRNRINAKIRDREVRMIDLERVLPARSFSNSLFRKSSRNATRTRVHINVEKAFAYIFELGETPQIYSLGSHINKSTFLITSQTNGSSYSSYNSATGEDALISILIDVFEASDNSLILFDEIEAGFHPNVQRRLADVLMLVSWYSKKQFIITTHSPAMMGAFPKKSRIFIDIKPDGTYHTIDGISVNAAYSRMDVESHPMINLFCEDELANQILQRHFLKMSNQYPTIFKLVNIVKCGSHTVVYKHYESFKATFSQMKLKVGYACVFDGDQHQEPRYQALNSDEDFVHFLSPNVPPEKYLVGAYLQVRPNTRLQTSYNNDNHHVLFDKMVALGLAVSRENAIEQCWTCFESTQEFATQFDDFKAFVIQTLRYFSERIE